MTISLDHLGLIPQKTLEEQVLTRLREAIIEGVFQSNTQINHVHISNQLGVSRGTIRAALSKLEEEGLVVNVPYKGTYVTEIDRKTVHDVYTMREVLEAYAVFQAIALCTDEDLKELHQIFEAMKTLGNEGKISEMIRMDLRLHAFYIQKAQNGILSQIWSDLEVRMRRVLAFRYFSHPYLQEMVDSHVQLIELTDQRKAAEAAELIRLHIREAYEGIMKNWPEK